MTHCDILISIWLKAHANVSVEPKKECESVDKSLRSTLSQMHIPRDRVRRVFNKNATTTDYCRSQFVAYDAMSSTMDGPVRCKK